MSYQNKNIRALSTQTAQELVLNAKQVVQHSRFKKEVRDLLKAEPGMEEEALQRLMRVSHFLAGKTSHNRQFDLYKKDRLKNLAEHYQNSIHLKEAFLDSLREEQFLKVLSEFSNAEMMAVTLEALEAKLKTKSIKEYIEYLSADKEDDPENTKKVLEKEQGRLSINLKALQVEMMDQIERTKNASNQYALDSTDEEKELRLMAEINHELFLEVLTFSNKHSLENVSAHHQVQSLLQDLDKKIANSQKHSTRFAKLFKEQLHDMELMIQLILNREDGFQNAYRQMQRPFYEYVCYIRDCLKTAIKSVRSGKIRFEGFKIKKGFLLTEKNIRTELYADKLEELFEKIDDAYASKDVFEIGQTTAIALEIKNFIASVDRYPLDFDLPFPIEAMVKKNTKNQYLLPGPVKKTGSVKPGEYKTMLGFNVLSGHEKTATELKRMLPNFIYGFPQLKQTLQLILDALEENKNVIMSAGEQEYLRSYENFFSRINEVVGLLDKPLDNDATKPEEVDLKDRIDRIFDVLIDVLSSSENLVILTKAKLTAEDLAGYKDDPQIQNLFRAHFADVNFNFILVQDMIYRMGYEVLISAVDDYTNAVKEEKSELAEQTMDTIKKWSAMLSVIDLQLPVLEEQDFKNINQTISEILKLNEEGLQPVLIDFSEHRRFEELLIYFLGKVNSNNGPLRKSLRIDFSALGPFSLVREFNEERLKEKVKIYTEGSNISLNADLYKVLGQNAGVDTYEFVVSRLMKLVWSLSKEKAPLPHKEFFIALESTKEGYPEIRLYANNQFVPGNDLTEYFYSGSSFDMKVFKNQNPILLNKFLEARTPEIRSAYQKLFMTFQPKAQRNFSGKIQFPYQTRLENSKDGYIALGEILTLQKQGVLYVPKVKGDFAYEHVPFSFINANRILDNLANKIEDFRTGHSFDVEIKTKLGFLAKTFKKFKELTADVLGALSDGPAVRTHAKKEKKVKPTYIKVVKTSSNVVDQTEHKTPKFVPAPVMPNQILEDLRLGKLPVYDVDEIKRLIEKHESVEIELNIHEFNRDLMLMHKKALPQESAAYIAFRKSGKLMAEFDAYNDQPLSNPFNVLELPFYRNPEWTQANNGEMIALNKNYGSRKLIAPVIKFKIYKVVRRDRDMSKATILKIVPVQPDLVYLNPRFFQSNEEFSANKFSGKNNISQDDYQLILDFK